MNNALARPDYRTQKTGPGLLERLKTLLAAAADRGTPVQVESRPYSFLSECECPADCFRDHENE